MIVFINLFSSVFYHHILNVDDSLNSHTGNIY